MGVRLWALLIAVLMLGSAFGGYQYAEATLPTQDGTWGQWIREAYGYFTNMLTLPYLTDGRLLTVDAAGNVTSTGIDVGTGDDLTGVDDLGAVDLTVSSLVAGRVPIVGVGGLIGSDADLTFSVDTLTATKIGATTLTGALNANGWDITGVDDITTDSVTSILGSFERLYTKIIVVAATGGNYTKLSDAFNAITDSSASKKYCIIVVGKIADNAVISPDSYVDVVGFSGDVTVTSNDAIHAILGGAIVDSTWRNLIVRRAGSPTTGKHVLALTGGDSKLYFINCQFLNEISTVSTARGVSLTSTDATFIDCYASGGSGGTLSTGWVVQETNTGRFSNCVGQGGSGGSLSTGWKIAGTGTSTFTNCKGIGGVGAYTGEYGWWISESDKSKYYSCIGDGGDATTSAHGWYIEGGITGTYQSCTGYGGNGGNNNHGWSIAGYAAGVFNDCVGYGGNGGTPAYGIRIGYAASPTLNACTGIGGNGVAGNQGINVEENSAAFLNGCNGDVSRYTALFVYDDANNGRFRPYATYPYMLLELYVQVDTGTAGAVLDIGTSIGGNEVINDIPIAVAGDYVYRKVVMVEVAANGYLYCTPSLAVPDGRFTVYCIVIRNFGDSNGLKVDTTGNARIVGGHYVSNGASNALLVTNNTINSDVVRFDGVSFETLDPVN